MKVKGQTNREMQMERSGTGRDIHNTFMRFKERYKVPHKKDYFSG